MRRPRGNSWKMDSCVQSSPIASHECSWSEPCICAWDGGGCCTPVFTGAGGELGDPRGGSRSCWLLCAGLFPGSGESCPGSCLFQGGGIDSGWSPGVPRYVICKGAGMPHLLQQGWSGPRCLDRCCLLEWMKPWTEENWSVLSVLCQKVKLPLCACFPVKYK